MQRTIKPQPQAVQLRLSRQLWRDVKHQAVDEGVPALHLVEQVLSAYVKAKKGEKVAAVLGVRRK